MRFKSLALVTASTFPSAFSQTLHPFASTTLSSTLQTLTLQGPNDSYPEITPHCFTPASLEGVGETNPHDCRAALEILIRQPHFTTRYSFSKNPRRGLKVPKGWTSGQCVIFVSCENDRDAYTFRLADVAANARKLVAGCVGKESERWGMLRWGGVDILGDSETFYVSVGRPVAPRPPGLGGGSVLAVVGNGSLVEVEVE